MGLISSTHSISRYHIEGNFEGSAAEEVRNNLIAYSIPKLESEFDALSAGWTPFESPYNPDFDKFSIQFGTFFLFSLRVDKKSIPVRLVQKYMALEIEKKMEKSGREFISKNEKTEIKEMVMDLLMHKIPAVPSVYEVLWNYEEQNLYLFTTQKAANELFETLFFKSFKLKPIRLFPYTLVETKSAFSNSDKDRIFSLAPLKYTR